MKGQAAVEFLLTYAWAFISLAIFAVVILAFITVRNPATISPATCFMSVGLKCLDSVFMSNGIGSQFIITFQNNLQQQIALPSGAINIYPTYASANYIGQCYPANVPIGAAVTCSVNSAFVPYGSQQNVRFTVQYELCTPNCVYPITTANVINTTGTSSMDVSPYLANAIRMVTLHTNPTGGTIYVDGVGYPDGAVVAFVANSLHSITATSSSTYPLTTWTVVNAVVSNGKATATATPASVTAYFGTLYNYVQVKLISTVDIYSRYLAIKINGGLPSQWWNGGYTCQWLISSGNVGSTYTCNIPNGVTFYNMNASVSTYTGYEWTIEDIDAFGSTKTCPGIINTLQCSMG